MLQVTALFSLSLCQNIFPTVYLLNLLRFFFFFSLFFDLAADKISVWAEKRFEPSFIITALTFAQLVMVENLGGSNGADNFASKWCFTELSLENKPIFPSR